MYQVEFNVRYITELNTNIVAKLMYTQCNADENEYLLDALVDYLMDSKAIFLTEQQTRIQGKSRNHDNNAGWIFCYQWKDGSISLVK